MHWKVIEILNFNLHHNLSNGYTHIYDEVPGLGGVGGRMVGKIIALKPLGNMKKMTEFGVNSFLRCHEAKIFVNLAENAQ